MDPAAAVGRGAGGRRRADRRRRPGRGAPSLDRTAHAGRRPPRPDGHAGLRRRPRPPGDLRPRPPALRPHRSRGPDGVPRGHRRVRRVAPGRGMDPRQWLVDGRFPGRHRRSRRSRSDRARPAGVPRDSRRAHGVGQQRGPGASRDHGHDPRSARRADRARRHGHARSARSRRLPRVPVYDVLPADTDEELVAALRLAQASSTRSGSPTGRTRRSRPRPTSRTRRSPTAASSAPGSSGRWAGTRRAATSRSRSWSSAGPRRRGRATRRRASSSCRRHPRELHRRRARAVSRPRTGGPPRTAATA